MRNSALANELLGHPATSERNDIATLVEAAHVSDHNLERLYRRLYDAYLSKRLSISEVRQALQLVPD